MLMQQHKLSIAKAFSHMEAASMKLRWPLRAIAEVIMLAEQLGL